MKYVSNKKIVPEISIKFENCNNIFIEVEWSKGKKLKHDYGIRSQL